MSMFLWFKLNFNENLDKLKYKSLQKCGANDYHPRSGTYTKPCAKYTYNTIYCDMHSYLQRISCKMYHYLHDSRLAHVPNNIKAEVELNARLQYCQRFSIKSDWGHSQWNEHLRLLSMSDYLPSSEKEERMKHISNEVLFNKVCLNALDESPMSLETGLHYRARAQSSDDDWDDWNDYDDQHDEKKFDKVMINKYLFDNYFKRSKLENISYIGLIQLSEQKCEMRW